MKNQIVLLQTNRFIQFTLCFFLLSVFLGAAPAPQKMSITPISQDTAVAEVMGPEPDQKADEGGDLIALIAGIASLVLVTAGGILLLAVSIYPVAALIMMAIGFFLSLMIITFDRVATKESRAERDAQYARAPWSKLPKIKRSIGKKIGLLLAWISIISALTIVVKSLVTLAGAFDNFTLIR